MLRWALRRIALGVPLAPVLLLGGCAWESRSGGGCTTDSREVTITRQDAVSRGIAFDDCSAICSASGSSTGGRFVGCEFLTEWPDAGSSLQDAYATPPDAVLTLDGWSSDDAWIASTEDAPAEDAPAEDAAMDDAGGSIVDAALALDDAGMERRPDGGSDPYAGLSVRVRCDREVCMNAGRRPSSVVIPRHAQSGVASWLANVATLEAAAVPAFAELRRELRAHGAPVSLETAALRAERDEVRHARVVGRLARLAGARPEAPVVVLGPPRSLAALATHNAAEGCVREAYGALSAYAQSRRAASPLLRRVFGGIARDEARHALFSLALDDWAMPRLRPVERRRARESREEAHAELRGAIVREDARSQRVLGVPDEALGHELAGLLA